jgi:hypothetical protein
LRIADCGLRIAVMNAGEIETEEAHQQSEMDLPEIGNPQSAIRNPYF